MGFKEEKKINCKDSVCDAATSLFFDVPQKDRLCLDLRPQTFWKLQLWGRWKQTTKELEPYSGSEREFYGDEFSDDRSSGSRSRSRSRDDEDEDAWIAWTVPEPDPRLVNHPAWVQALQALDAQAAFQARLAADADDDWAGGGGAAAPEAPPREVCLDEEAALPHQRAWLERQAAAAAAEAAAKEAAAVADYTAAMEAEAAAKAEAESGFGLETESGPGSESQLELEAESKADLGSDSESWVASE